jgi:hypothetical protein
MDPYTKYKTNQSKRIHPSTGSTAIPEKHKTTSKRIDPYTNWLDSYLTQATATAATTAATITYRLATAPTSNNNNRHMYESIHPTTGSTPTSRGRNFSDSVGKNSQLARGKA